MRFSLKSQISVFILLVLLVGVLFVFLIDFEAEEQRSSVESYEFFYETPQGEGTALEDSFELCLEVGLEKALLISGLKGGFLFQGPGQDYLPIINSEFYNLLSTLNLSQQYVNSIMISHDYTLKLPYKSNFSENGSYWNYSTSGFLPYQNSISSTIEEYIAFEYFSCLNLENPKYDDLQVETLRYSSKISPYSSLTGSFYLLEKPIGEIGDEVYIIISGTKYLGEIVQDTSYEEGRLVSFSTPLNFGTALSPYSFWVANSKGKDLFEVDFEREQVEARFYSPTSFQSQDFSESFEEISVVVENREFLMFEFFRILLEQKQQNKSFNLSNSTLVSQTLESSFPMFNVSEFSYYFENLFLGEESRTDLLTLKDTRYALFGENYTLRTIYTNTHPFFNSELIEAEGLTLNGDEIVIYTQANSPFSFNLKNLVEENQIWDRYTLSFEVEELGSYSEDYYKFSLDSLGNMTFENFLDGIFRFEVTVTDGELQDTLFVTYVSGIPKNIANSETKDCVIYKNIEQDKFPILGENGKPMKLKDTLFRYKNPSSDKFELHGYYLATTTPEISISEACLFEYQGGYAKISINGVDMGQEFTFDDFEDYISLPVDDSIINEISVSLHRETGESLLVENYTFDLIPADCLGPGEIYDAQDKQMYGTSLNSECCNLSGIRGDGEVHLPSTLVGNILDSGQVAANAEVLFSYDVFTDPDAFIDFSPWKNSIYSLINWPMSVFEARFKATCGGTYPRLIDNVEGIFPLGTADFIQIGVDEYYESNNGGWLSINPVISGIGGTHYNSNAVGDTTKICHVPFFTDSKEFPIVNGIAYNKFRKTTESPVPFAVQFYLMNTSIPNQAGLYPIQLQGDNEIDPDIEKIIMKCSDEDYYGIISGGTIVWQNESTIMAQGLPLGVGVSDQSFIKFENSYCDATLGESCGKYINWNQGTFLQDYGSSESDSISLCRDAYINSAGDLATTPFASGTVCGSGSVTCFSHSCVCVSSYESCSNVTNPDGTESESCTTICTENEYVSTASTVTFNKTCDGSMGSNSCLTPTDAVVCQGEGKTTSSQDGDPCTP